MVGKMNGPLEQRGERELETRVRHREFRHGLDKQQPAPATQRIRGSNVRAVSKIHPEIFVFSSENSLGLNFVARRRTKFFTRKCLPDKFMRTSFPRLFSGFPPAHFSGLSLQINPKNKNSSAANSGAFSNQYLPSRIFEVLASPRATHGGDGVPPPKKPEHAAEH